MTFWFGGDKFTVEDQIQAFNKNPEARTKEPTEAQIREMYTSIEAALKDPANAGLHGTFREWIAGLQSYNPDLARSLLKVEVLQALKLQATERASMDANALRAKMGADQPKDIATQKQEIKNILSDLSPDKMEGSFLATERLIQMCPEQYKTLLRGYAGSLILESFERHGQYIALQRDNTVAVATLNGARQDATLNENNANLALRMNALIRTGRLNPDTIKTGMLYRAKSFESYSASLRGADGRVLDPRMAGNPNAYFEHLRKLESSGYKLSPSETALMASSESFGSYGSMNQAIEQLKDFEKLSNAIARKSAVPGLSGADTQGKDIPKTAPGKSQEPNGVASAVGEGIGTIGGMIGKIAGAGARGGMSVLSDTLAAATREGGAFGALAVIGGLIAAIWKFGFWKTIGGIFGIGVVSEAAAGRLDLGKEMDKAKALGQKIKPETQKQSSRTQETKERMKKTDALKDMDEEKFNAIHDSLADSEEFKKLSITGLQDALEKKNDRTPELFFADISDIGGMRWSEFYARDPENTEKILKELLVQKESGDTLIGDLFVHSATDSDKPSVVPLAASSAEGIESMTPAQMEKEAISLEQEGYSSLYILARALELGFIPKTHDLAFKDPNPMKGRKWEWVKLKWAYIFEGGALTNGTMSALNKPYAWFNAQLSSVLHADLLVERIQAREMLALGTKLPSPDVTNLKERIRVLDSLERAFASGGDKTLISELLRDYKALSGENFSALTRKYNVDLLGSKVAAESARVQQEMLRDPSVLGYNAAEAKIAELRTELAKQPLDSKKIKTLRSEIESMVSGFRFSRSNAGIAAQLDGLSQNLALSRQNIVLVQMDAKLQELQVALAKNPIDQREVSRLKKEYETLGNNALLQKGEKHADAASREKEALEQAKQRIDQINSEIAQLKEEAKNKLAEFDKLAGKDPTRIQEYAAEWERFIQEMNAKITALEAEGVKNLQALNPESIKNLAKQSPWVANIAKANGWVDGVVQTKTGKVLMGTALLTVVWNSKDGLADIWNKWLSKENVKTGGDLIVGFIPVLGWAHDLMIANNDWYKKLWLGDRKLSKEELIARDAFGAIGLIPGLGTITKAVGKWSITVVRWAEVAIHGAQLAGKVGTYGYLGYSLVSSVAPVAVNVYDSLPSRK